MKQISSLDLYFLTKELKILENNRIDNFYFENGIFYLKIYIKRVGNKLLTVNPGKYIFLGEEKQESTFPTSFIQHLRKNLKNCYIVGFNQIQNERIIDIEIEKKVGEEITKYHLLIEMFANGNIIFTNSDYLILNTLQRKKFKDRKIIVKEKYELPPAKELSIFNLDKKLFKKEFNLTDLSIVKFLAIKLGMGGKFAEEICLLANIDKNSNEISDFSKLFEILEKIKDFEIAPFGIYKEKELIDFIPFDFKSINQEKKEFKEFNLVLKEYFSNFKILEDPKEKQFKIEMKKLETRLKKQEKQMKNIEEDYEKYNNLGNKIYENYELIEELLKQINEAEKEKGWTYVKSQIKENEKLKKLVKNLNYKNNEIVINLE